MIFFPKFFGLIVLLKGAEGQTLSACTKPGPLGDEPQEKGMVEGGRQQRTPWGGEKDPRRRERKMVRGKEETKIPHYHESQNFLEERHRF